jgi:hypothetical protein
LKTKKDGLKTFELFTSLRFIKQILMISLDLYKSKDERNMVFNVIIQDSILTKDFNKIIKAAFFHYNDAFHPKKVLCDLIEFIELVIFIVNIISILLASIHILN